VRCRALYFDGNSLRLIHDHVVDRGDEVLVRVRYAGICGTDLQILRGYAGFRGVPGHEFVGVVEEADDEALVGKRVVGEINVACGRCDMCRVGLKRHCRNRTVLGIKGRDGSFSEYLRLPAENLHEVPHEVSDEEAVFVEPLAAALEIVEQLHLEPSYRVAVIGDGRLANLIAQVLRYHVQELRVFGKHERKLRVLESLGIETTTSVSEDERWRYDVVVEVTGRESGLKTAIELVRPRGTIVLKSTIAGDYRIDLAPVVVNEVRIVGSRCGQFPPAIAALRRRIVDVKRLIDRVYPLEDHREAFDAAASPDTLKVLLKP